MENREELTERLLQAVIATTQPRKFEVPLSETDAKQQVILLKALSDPTRLRMLSLLSRHGGEICVQEITNCFRLEQPTVTFHLRVLYNAGLVDNHKKSLHVYYYVRAEALARALSIIEGLA